MEITFYKTLFNEQLTTSLYICHCWNGFASLQKLSNMCNIVYGCIGKTILHATENMSQNKHI